MAYSKLKSGLELSELCSTTIRTLCGGSLLWDMDRYMNFSLFCNQLIIQMNIPPLIVYAGLKYFQHILVNSVDEYDIIDLSDIAHEYSLFTVSLSLAYKYLDDNPPFMKQWSFVSMIPTRELVLLESQVLNKLGYSLSLSVPVLNEWIEQCNTIHDMPFIAFNNVFDLHMTYTRLGYNALLPVLLDDFYILPAFNQMTYDDNLIMCNSQQQQQQNDYFFDDSNITACMIPQTAWLQQVPIPMDHLWYPTYTH